MAGACTHRLHHRRRNNEFMARLRTKVHPRPPMRIAHPARETIETHQMTRNKYALLSSSFNIKIIFRISRGRTVHVRALHLRGTKLLHLIRNVCASWLLAQYTYSLNIMHLFLLANGIRAFAASTFHLHNVSLSRASNLVFSFVFQF